jgi:hypothetical protein
MSIDTAPGKLSSPEALVVGFHVQKMADSRQQAVFVKIWVNWALGAHPLTNLLSLTTARSPGVANEIEVGTVVWIV